MAKELDYTIGARERYRRKKAKEELVRIMTGLGYQVFQTILIDACRNAARASEIMELPDHVEWRLLASDLESKQTIDNNTEE
jgi:hypothetical protein